jgi:hypothetical protein
MSTCLGGLQRVPSCKERKRILLAEFDDNFRSARQGLANPASRPQDDSHTRLHYFCSLPHQDSALRPVVGQLERAAGFHIALTLPAPSVPGTMSGKVDPFGKIDIPQTGLERRGYCPAFTTGVR